MATKVESIEKLVPPVEEFLKAGSHFGHTTRRWHPSNKQYIYKQKQNMQIIDVRETRARFVKAMEVLEEVLAQKGNILIVGTKKQAANLVKSFAEKYGLYYVVDKWPSGLFTNFSVLSETIFKLMRLEKDSVKFSHTLPKKELLTMKRQAQKMRKQLEGVMFMKKAPDLMIIIDVRYEVIALKEAALKKVPVIGLVDTDSDSRFITHPVPINDDAIRSLKLVLDTFAALFEKRLNTVLIKRRENYQKDLDILQKKVDHEAAVKEKMEQEEFRVIKSSKVDKAKKVETKVKVIKASQLQALDTLDLSPGVVAKLTKGGIKSVETLKQKSLAELKSIPGIGDKTAQQILKVVKKVK